MNINARSTARCTLGGGLLFFIAASVVGCQLSEPVALNDSTDPVHDQLQHATAQEVWLALARAVKAQTIESTERLAQVVLILRRNGELSEQDLAGFDRVFPEIASKTRVLSEADIQVLIQLGQVKPR